ncbi:MAG: asparagine synthase (glutamine-hydrolyzing) [Gammaproteobacteria bacterium]|nr:asparagine synthase (glutamine-hydrolyzing) [Gammaproteobacteria bacterium]MDP2140734.1 asparagine synthase (glutamine-hydrolyzing) [Gammaproteobacteria bacterium]MDP2346988.1 asparagine synthase (glutamine-hydrolyzing) [Gammaproteobacteria bacterium]
MCGIAGIAGSKGHLVHHDEIKAMCDALIHRGPDDDGYFVENGIGMGMRRLSIIDVNNGDQPAWNETHDICVVLNGEIYNYQELRLELIERGHVFRNGSDTEVIVHLYEEMGESCVDRLRGMFAFAVWDRKKEVLILARDRLGIKPLYYAEVNGRLLFASEMKALLQLPDIKKEFNWASVSYLFSFLSTPPSESILAGVHKLQPGTLLRFSRDAKLQLQQYWDIQFSPDHARSEAATIEILQEKLDDAVRYCMVSDVPVGAFLSGGLDSSAVVALMAKSQQTPVKTFSIGFSNADYDETRFAREVSEALGTEHHEMTLQSDAAELMHELAWFLDEPFGDSSAIPTYMVSQLAARHVKVILSGDGGDEVFAGYDKYLVENRERSRPQLPQPLLRMIGSLSALLPEGVKGRNYLRHMTLQGSDRYLDSSTLYSLDQKTSLFNPQFAEQVLACDAWRDAARTLSRSGDTHWLSSLQYQDIKNYLPLDILTKVDRMSMANSLEVRVPLLDHKLLEFAATIPADMRLKQGQTKYIFKQAMRGLLPEPIIDRRKQGFAIPLGQWFRGDLNSFVRELLLSERCLARGIFNANYIRKLITLHDQGRPLAQHLWVLISFELWCRRYMDQNLVNVTLRNRAPSTVRRNVIAHCPEILHSYSEGR